MIVEKASIKNLNAATYNPRKDLKPTDPEYVKLKNSIEHFGYVEPIIVNKNNMTVVGGHQRLKVLKDLGYTNIDVVYVDLNSTDEKALNIALNKISGDWDAEKLEDLLRDISLDTDFDVELTGFSLDEVTKLFGDIDSDGFDVDPNNFDESFSLDNGEKERKLTMTIHLLESDMNNLKNIISKTGEKDNSKAILEVCKQWAELKK